MALVLAVLWSPLQQSCAHPGRMPMSSQRWHAPLLFPILQLEGAEVVPFLWEAQVLSQVMSPVL